jgi:hypothetical protein
LPNPSLITEPGKISNMIWISLQGLRGEDDVRFLREEETRTSVVNDRDSRPKSEGMIWIGGIFSSLISLAS